MPLNSIAAGKFLAKTNKNIKISRNSSVEPNTLFDTDHTLDQSQTMFLKQKL